MTANRLKRRIHQLNQYVETLVQLAKQRPESSAEYLARASELASKAANLAAAANKEAQ